VRGRPANNALSAGISSAPRWGRFTSTANQLLANVYLLACGRLSPKIIAAQSLKGMLSAVAF